MIRVLTVIGARPQWMKASALSRALKNPKWGIEERVLHTGQHYSENMAGSFVKELDLPRAHHALTVSTNPAERMGQMMGGIQTAIQQDKPAAVLLFGDTDSTLAGAWAASREGIPAVHIEAGLRSFDRRMPEEINRILTDALSDLLFCPSETAVGLLADEGITTGVRGNVRVEVSGDLMLDTARFFGGQPVPPSQDAKSVLLTMHRPSNVDDPDRLSGWITNIGAVARSKGWQVIFPIHPRTAKMAEIAFGVHWKERMGEQNIQVEEPAGYLQIIEWLKEVRQVWTDSGGLQKEAYFMHRPAVILRNSSEWTELLDSGVAALCPEPTDLDSCVGRMESRMESMDFNAPLYGDGNAAQIIARTLHDWLKK